MWTCPLCSRSFKSTDQIHYCGDNTVGGFLLAKTDVSLELFDYLILRFEQIGPIKLYATKSMIVIAHKIKFAYIINLGKSFVDIVLPFKQAYTDNFCFRKIALVPGSDDYNHHLRLMHVDDINEEVFNYMKLAYDNGKGV